MKTIYAYRCRRVPYTVIVGQHGVTVKAERAISALRQVQLTPGAKVRVWCPQIVHARRARRR